MARTKSKRGSKSAAGGGLGGAAVKVGKKILGKGKGGDQMPRRAKSVEHWAKKVIIAKLKNKFFKVKYGNVK